MARIKLELPVQYSFATSIPIRITDLNYGGHVGNDTMLSLLHEARMRFLQHHGYTEMDLNGTSLIMADVAIEYKSELFYGDELKAYVSAFDFSRVGFDVAYKLVKNTDEKLVIQAKTGMVCFDYKLQKMVRVPEEVATKLRS